MMNEPSMPQAAPSAPARPSRRASVVWRVVAIAVVIIITIAVAHALRNPAKLGGGAETPGPGPFDAPSPPPPPAPGDEGQGEGAPSSARQEGADSLRQVMAGLMMAALSGEDGDPDAAGRDAEAQRRFIADRFGVSPDYPGSAAPAGLMPEGAEVLMVFENPRRTGDRMVLVRVRQGVEATLETFSKTYAKDGWAVVGGMDPKAQPDRGWLVRFSKGRRERFVYARARQSGEETLAAVYEARY